MSGQSHKAGRAGRQLPGLVDGHGLHLAGRLPAQEGRRRRQDGGGGDETVRGGGGGWGVRAGTQQVRLRPTPGPLQPDGGDVHHLTSVTRYCSLSPTRGDLCLEL